MNLFSVSNVMSLMPMVLYTAILNMDSEQDRAFITDLYLSYNAQLHTYATCLCDSKADAEDAVQDVFLALIPKVSKLQTMQKDRLKGYLFASVKHAVYMIHRTKEQITQAESSSLLFADNDQEEQPMVGYRYEDLKAALPSLNEKDRALLQMKYFLGQTDGEIADQLKVQPESVKMLVWRARQRLISILKEGEEDNA